MYYSSVLFSNKGQQAIHYSMEYDVRMFIIEMDHVRGQHISPVYTLHFGTRQYLSFVL